MVGFVHSLHMKSDLNPKKKLYPFSGDGVFFVPDCTMVVAGTISAGGEYPRSDGVEKHIVISKEGETRSS